MKASQASLPLNALLLLRATFFLAPLSKTSLLSLPGLSLKTLSLISFY